MNGAWLPLSWRLWRALQRPPTGNPLYRWHVKHAGLRSGARPFSGLGLVLIPILTVGGLCLLVALLAYLLPVVLLALPLLFVLSANASAVGWAASISGGIADEQERGRFDVLGVLPWGALGTIWLMSAATVNRRRTQHHWLRLFAGLAVVSVLCTMELTLMALDWGRYWRGGMDATAQLSIIVVAALGLIPLFLIDFIQTVALSVTLGMSARGTGLAVDARLWTAFLFLAVQGTVYALAGVLGAGVAPALLAGRSADGAGAVFVALAILAAVLVIPREVLIAGLWRRIRDEYALAPTRDWLPSDWLRAAP